MIKKEEHLNYLEKEGIIGYFSAEERKKILRNFYLQQAKEFQTKMKSEVSNAFMKTFGAKPSNDFVNYVILEIINSDVPAALKYSKENIVAVVAKIFYQLIAGKKPG